MPPGLRLISMVCPSFVPILVKVSQFAVSFCGKAPLSQHRYLPIYPLVDPNDTLVKTSPQSGSIFSIALQPKDTTVPPHLQELFDETVSHANMSESLQQSLAAVLRRNSDAFATGTGNWGPTETGPLDLGFCAVLQHDIDTGDALPIKQSPRKPRFAARDAEDAILDEMLQTGVIEQSNSPWSSPVCMVKKKDDTYRFCIGYRRLNDVTKKDAFPVPDVKDALDSLCGAKYFATIDLLSGYWQLGMTDCAKERSAFCTRRGLFQFTRMPFGLSNARSFFLSAHAHHPQRLTLCPMSLLLRRHCYFSRTALSS